MRGFLRSLAWWLADRDIFRERIEERYRRRLIADPSPIPLPNDATAAAGRAEIASTRRR